MRHWGKMSAIFVFGDSHAGTLLEYRRLYWSSLPDVLQENFHVNFVDEGGLAQEILIESVDGRMINPIMQKTLHLAGLYDRYNTNFSCKGANILLLFGFADSHMIGLNPSWEGFCLGVDDGIDDYYIDTRILTETLRWRLNKLFEFAEILADMGANVTFLPGPPPHKENDYIAERRPDLKTIPKPEFRRQTYRELVEIFTLRCSGGVQFLNLTTAFSDREGYLLPKYNGDGVHANLEYARDYLSLISEKV